MSSRWLVVATLALASAVAAGCGDIMLPYGLDAGDDGPVNGQDGSVDGPADGPGDGSGVDAPGAEAGLDATLDAPADSPGVDATLDAPAVDATQNDATSVDSSVDSAMGDAGDGGAPSDAGDAMAFDASDASDAADAAETAPPVVNQVTGVVVTTFAGSATAGSQDGNGTSAQFDNPVTLALDPMGNVLVTEYDGDRVRKITPSADVTTLVSQGDVFRPFAIAVAADGTIVLQTDWNQNGVNNATSGTLWKVFAGGFTQQMVPSLHRPRGLGALPNDTIGVTDRIAHTVMILDLTTSLLTPLAGADGQPGFVDDVGSLARFNEPYGAAAFADGTLLVADSANNRLRTIAPNGTVSTFAGTGAAGMVDGQRISAQLNAPRDVAIDAAGNVYFSDVGNHRIRRIDTTGLVQTIAGDGTAGFNDGTGDVAEFFGQEGLDVTSDGKTLYVTDGTLGNAGLPYNRIRKITIP